MSEFDDDVLDFTTAPVGQRASKAKQSFSLLNQKLKHINEKYSFIIHGATTGVLRESKSREGAINIHILSKEHFINIFASQSIPDPENEAKRVNLGKAWWAWPQRREYLGGLVFQPGLSDVGQGEYNLWTDFSYEASEDGSCNLFLAHVRNNICSGCNESYNWLMSWCAAIVQYPARRRDAAVILRSKEEGTGKSFFADVIGKLMHRHYLSVLNPEHIIGKFNSHLANKILIFADEAFTTDDKKARAIMYGMISGHTLPLEPKGKDVQNIEFYARFIIASNHEWVVPAGMDARRWAVFDVAAHAKQNREYFLNIENQMNNGGYAKLMHTLLNWEITESFWSGVPSTTALLEQKIASLTTAGQWWFETLLDGTINEPNKIEGFWPVTIKKQDLFTAYLDWCRRRTVRPIPDNSWGRTLKRLCRSIHRRQNVQNANVYDLPELDQAREEFASAMGQKVDWQQ